MSASCHEEPKRLPMVVGGDVEANTGHARTRSSSSIKSGKSVKSSSTNSSGDSPTAHTNALARKAGLVFLFILFLRQFALVLAVAPYLAPRTTDGATVVAETPRVSSVVPGDRVEESNGDRHDSSSSAGRLAGLSREEAQRFRPPRIVTVLTTYGKRSAFVKPYKEAVSERGDGYRPEVRVVGLGGRSIRRRDVCRSRFPDSLLRSHLPAGVGR